MNKSEYNKHLIKIILAFVLPTIVIFIYDIQIRVFKYDSGLWFYLLFCIGEVGLAIMINSREKGFKK